MSNSGSDSIEQGSDFEKSEKQSKVKDLSENDLEAKRIRDQKLKDLGILESNPAKVQQMKNVEKVQNKMDYHDYENSQDEEGDSMDDYYGEIPKNKKFEARESYEYAD